jgi:L-2-hydroxyglutarate oxidase
MNTQTADVAIIGGGIVGLATAMALCETSSARHVVLEAESDLATHQTGHNSGVIHSGLYYKPGSLKALNCTTGRELLYQFCAQHAIPHERCGKIVVATCEAELPALEELFRRGIANGLEGLRRLSPPEIREREPHATGIAGLLVPQTGIVDYRLVSQAYAEVVRQCGGHVATGQQVRSVIADGDAFVLETATQAWRARALINCGGLQSDRVARMCGVEPGVAIVPFRGEYYELAQGSAHLVKHLIYPVPDPRFPFLGVHFTRRITGGIEAGPNAVLALNREGYGRTSFSGRDTWQLLRYRGFWRLARRYWRTGCGELHRSFSKQAFVAALQRLIPELTLRDLVPGGAGVRAQAVEPDGTLVDDFRIVDAPRMIHVLNAPSPAATASIAIGRTIAQRAVRNFSLAARPFVKN